MEAEKIHGRLSGLPNPGAESVGLRTCWTDRIDSGFLRRRLEGAYSRAVNGMVSIAVTPRRGYAFNVPPSAFGQCVFEYIECDGDRLWVAGWTPGTAGSSYLFSIPLAEIGYLAAAWEEAAQARKAA